MAEDDKEKLHTTPAPASGTTAAKKRRKRKVKRSANGTGGGNRTPVTKQLAFPKHSLLNCLRIPKAVLEQNAGKECVAKDAAKFAGIGYTGDIGVEISSALKYGLLERPTPGMVKPTEITRRIVRPQKPNDEIEAMREAVLQAPVISDVYKHYRGENLPDRSFLVNTARDSFHVPADRVEEFVDIFVQTLKDAKLLQEVDGKQRVLDVTHTEPGGGTSNVAADEHLKKVSKGVAVEATDTCFVMMPFDVPLGAYYETIYEPAIKKAGLTPIRADNEIFGTGKIIDQIYAGINAAKILVAELTTRNANVFYELGLAHALGKPVVLVSKTQEIPFDVSHVRVIYYDVNDPFWGNKLIDKVAENIISAIKNPKEAILFQAKG